MLSDECSNLRLGHDSVVKSVKGRARVGDSGGDAIEDPTLQPLHADGDDKVGHGQLQKRKSNVGETEGRTTWFTPEAKTKKCRP